MIRIMNRKQSKRERQRQQLEREEWQRERQRQQREGEAWNQAHMPIVGELKNCCQLSDDCWQGIDAADGSVVNVRGGLMPKYLLVELREYRPYRDAWGLSRLGIIRVLRSEQPRVTP